MALISMSKKKFRTRQAIEAFETCLKCSNLPEEKIAEVTQQLKKSKSVLARQEEEVF